MGIVSSTELIKKTIEPIRVIELDSPDITESGVFCFYDGATPVDLGVVLRSFSILCAGFSFSGASELVGDLETVEGAICSAAIKNRNIRYVKTHPAMVTEDGLYIYKIDIEIFDADTGR